MFNDASQHLSLCLCLYLITQGFNWISKSQLCHVSSWLLMIFSSILSGEGKGIPLTVSQMEGLGVGIWLCFNAAVLLRRLCILRWVEKLVDLKFEDKFRTTGKTRQHIKWKRKIAGVLIFSSPKSPPSVPVEARDQISQATISLHFIISPLTYPPLSSI